MCPPPRDLHGPGVLERVERLKQDLLAKVQVLGRELPVNTLDELIDQLGGPECVAEVSCGAPWWPAWRWRWSRGAGGGGGRGAAAAGSSVPCPALPLQPLPPSSMPTSPHAHLPRTPPWARAPRPDPRPHPPPCPRSRPSFPLCSCGSFLGRPSGATSVSSWLRWLGCHKKISGRWQLTFLLMAPWAPEPGKRPGPGSPLPHTPKSARVPGGGTGKLRPTGTSPWATTAADSLSPRPHHGHR